MRNLIQFIYRYHVALLFLGMELVGFLLLVRYNNYHEIRWLSWSGEFTGQVYEGYHRFTSYLNLREANEQLAEENAALKDRLREAYLNESESFFPVFDSTYRQQYEFIPAQVIQSTVNQQNNYLILNRGSVHGIQPEMGVLSPQGVVGVVTEVTNHYATVMSVLHRNARISTRLQKNNYFGIATWDGEDPSLLQLSDIPVHVTLQAGDTLVTRGASGIFPQGQPVGYVRHWEEDPSTNFYRIELEPGTDFRQVYHVQVVRNLFKMEVDSLEVQMEEADG